LLSFRSGIGATTYRPDKRHYFAFDALLSEHPAALAGFGPTKSSRLHQQAMAPLGDGLMHWRLNDAWRLREACIQALLDAQQSKNHA